MNIDETSPIVRPLGVSSCGTPSMQPLVSCSWIMPGSQAELVESGGHCPFAQARILLLVPLPAITTSVLAGQFSTCAHQQASKS